MTGNEQLSVDELADFFGKGLSDAVAAGATVVPSAPQSTPAPEPEAVAIEAPPALPDLRPQLERLLGARSKYVEANDKLAQARGELLTFQTAWQTKHAATIEAANVAKAAMEDEERALKDAALAIFEETGDKYPGPGVMVKVFTVLHYSSNRALQWCAEHGLFLSYDRKGFEEYCKSQPGTVEDFVVIDSEPRAEVTSKLAEALLGGGK